MWWSNLNIQLVLVAALVLPASLSAADRTEVAGQVSQLLETGWKSSAGSYTAAQQQYEQAKKTAAGDVRVPYAMALVAIKRYRLDDASKYLDEALASEKPLLAIRRVKFWLDLQRKDQAAQKADVRKLVGILAANSAQAERADDQETARWLGVVLGYYSAPGKGQLSPADREVLDAEVSGQLTGPWAKLLAEGRNRCGAQYQKLQADLAAARKQVKAKNEITRAEERRKNEADLQDCNAKLQAAQLELGRIQREPVVVEYNSLLGNLAYERTQLPSRPRGGKDETRDEEEKAERSYQDDLDKVSKKINAIEARLKVLYPQMQTIQFQLAPFVAIVKEQEKTLQALQKQQKQLAIPVMENDEATLAQDAAAKSFATYSGMSLEQEKQRILTSFGAK